MIDIELIKEIAVKAGEEILKIYEEEIKTENLIESCLDSLIESK